MKGAGRVLVVDDDPSLGEMLAEYLGSHGYEVAVAADGESMRASMVENLPDVVLVDLRLPREDGLSLTRYLREHYAVGIIMVTASGEVVDRIVGLEIGADDYVAKPFDPRELLARIKSVQRRTRDRRTHGTTDSPEAPRTRVPLGHCSLDLESHQLYDGASVEIPLTTMEFDLLRVFVENPGKALSRDRLLTLTRNRGWDPYDRSIDIRVARLRRKLEVDPDNPRLIRTVRGVGYMFVPGSGEA